MTTKENYSIRIDSDNKKILKNEISNELIRSVLNYMCELHKDHIGVELIVEGIELDYLKESLKATENKRNKLMKIIEEKQKNFDELEEVYSREYVELDRVWNELYKQHFQYNTIRSDFDIASIISNCFIEDSVILEFLIRKTKQMLINCDKKTRKDVMWLLERLEYMDSDSYIDNISFKNP